MMNSYRILNTYILTFQIQRKKYVFISFVCFAFSVCLCLTNCFISNNIECLNLRRLLHIVNDPTSFKSIRTVKSVTCDTFQGACKAFGLLDDESHWKNTLSEATTILCLFAIMLTFYRITLYLITINKA